MVRTAFKVKVWFSIIDFAQSLHYNALNIVVVDVTVIPSNKMQNYHSLNNLFSIVLLPTTAQQLRLYFTTKASM